MDIFCDSKKIYASNKHFRECERQGLPFLQVRNKIKYATVHYDMISCHRHNGTVLALEGHKAAYLIGLLYFIREGPIAYGGIGRVVGFIDTLKELAPELTERLWPVLSDPKNRLTPEERWTRGNDDREHSELLGAWPILGFKEDFRRAIKTKIPLIKLGWEISGDSIKKKSPGLAGARIGGKEQ